MKGCVGPCFWLCCQDARLPVPICRPSGILALRFRHQPKLGAFSQAIWRGARGHATEQRRGPFFAARAVLFFFRRVQPAFFSDPWWLIVLHVEGAGGGGGMGARLQFICYFIYTVAGLSSFEDRQE